MTRRDLNAAVSGMDLRHVLLEHDGQLAAAVMVAMMGHRGWVYYLGVARLAGNRAGKTMMQRL